MACGKLGGDDGYGLIEGSIINTRASLLAGRGLDQSKEEQSNQSAHITRKSYIPQDVRVPECDHCEVRTLSIELGSLWMTHPVVVVRLPSSEAAW